MSQSRSLSNRQSFLMRPLFALFMALLFLAGPVASQTPPSVSAPAPASELDQVQVRGQRENDAEDRRQSTATKIVIGREEIEKQGDSTIGEVLKRLPGVTMGGAPGRRGAIRMRGLGSGYTQILLDGERVPPGFSIDQITPEQVERIEVMRAPTAETGARAIAGTINIILREGYRGTPDDLKLTMSRENEQTARQGNWVHNLKGAGMSGTLTLSASDSDRADSTLGLTQSSAFADRERESNSLNHRRGLHANARLQWRGAQGNQLTLMPFVVYSESESEGSMIVRSSAGISDTAQTQAHSRFAMARLNGQLMRRLSDDDRLEARFGMGQSRYDNQSQRIGASEVIADSAQPLLRNGIETQSFVDNSASLTGKWSRSLGSGHQWVSGIEFERVHRDEQGDAATPDESGDLDAGTRRWAIYSQDEFRINTHWSAYAGLRYEALMTEGTVAGALKHNESAVWTPLLHALYKPDPSRRDQIRMSLTRSYKTPSLYQLVARYRPSIGANSWTQPDRSGNPDLRPELAIGVDLAFERYLARGGVLSANIFRRNVSDLIRQTTSFNGSRYVSAPTNVGKALTQGIELEAKFRLDQWLSQAWPVEVRSNLSFFHSKVLDVAPPDNRLDQQPSATANLGADYRLRGVPLTLGGNFNWNPAYDTRRTEQQWVYQGAKKVLDVYGLWRLSPTASLRLSVTNLVPLDYVTGSSYIDGLNFERSRTSDHNWRTVQFRLEMRI